MTFIFSGLFTGMENVCFQVIVGLYELYELHYEG